MFQASTCGLGLALAWVQVLQNSASLMVLLRFTTLPARDHSWRNPRKKKYRERSNKKSACVSAPTGLVPRKMAEAWQSVSALFRNQTHDARLSATHLNQQAINRCQCLPLVCIDCCIVVRHLQPICLHTGLLCLDFSSWISRLGKNTRILERKPMIDKSYCILHRLELKYFHLAHFLLNAQRAAHLPRKSENW